MDKNKMIDLMEQVLKENRIKADYIIWDNVGDHWEQYEELSKYEKRIRKEFYKAMGEREKDTKFIRGDVVLVENTDFHDGIYEFIGIGEEENDFILTKNLSANNYSVEGDLELTEYVDVTVKEYAGEKISLVCKMENREDY